MKEKNKNIKKLSGKKKKSTIDKKPSVKNKAKTEELTAAEKLLMSMAETLNKLSARKDIVDEYEEEYREPSEPIDLVMHCEDMSFHFHETIKDLKEWLVIQLCVDYAVVCKRLTVKVNISLNDDKNSISMQPYTPLDPETRTFCAIRVFVWSDEAKKYDFIRDLKLVGAEVKDLYVVGDIKKALGVA